MELETIRQDEALLGLLETQNQLLQEILYALPDETYYTALEETSALLRAYMEGSPAGTSGGDFWLNEAVSSGTEAPGEGTDASPAESLEEMAALLAEIRSGMSKDATLSDFRREVQTAMGKVEENTQISGAHLSNLENLQIPMLCGVGILIGGLCAAVLARFLHH